MKIIAVVVTYNRLSLLKKNIECLNSQTRAIDKIVIINNASTDGTKEYCMGLVDNNEKVIVVNLEKNTGGAGGFYEGIKKAISLDADYIWGMDDDAMPREEALEVLVNKSNNYSCKKYCLASNTYFYNETHELKQVQFEDDCEIEHLTFVGFFIPSYIIKKIGYPRKDLFIYYDDLDYSLRIIENNFKIIGISESIIEHPYIMPENYRKFLGISVNVPKMPKWKMYYWMRNNLLIRKKEKRKYFKTLILEFYVLIKIALFEPDSFSIALKGMVHGMNNVSGHFEDV